MSEQNNNKTEEKLSGIDKWIIDFSFLEGYFKKVKEIIKRNFNNAEFIQTKLLLDRYWTESIKKVNPIFMAILEQESENYFLDNYFLYDHFIFHKMVLKSCDDNFNHRSSIVIHPILFIINLAILLYFQDNRKSKYLEFAYTKYNLNYKIEEIYFDTKNKLLFDENYYKLLNLYKNVLKLSIKNFYNSITESVFRKFAFEKYDINLEILEIIINYSKNICGDGNKIFPVLEFSPLYSYLSTSCILEGIINEIIDFIKSVKLDFSILCFEDEIYLFFNDNKDWFEIKLIIDKILFKNNFELDYQNLVVIKNDNVLVQQKNSLIKFDVLYYSLIDHFRDNSIFIDSSNILRKYLKSQNLNNSFLLGNVNNISENEYKKMIKTINSVDDNNYFRIIDSNPKYFINFFSTLDKKYSDHNEFKFMNEYLNKKLVSKFSEYKNTEKMINEEYYIYYYLYNSFKGLFNNEIYDDKFFDNIDPNYKNFQEFILSIYEKEFYSYLADNPQFKIKHNKYVSSLLFFLRNQYRLNNYNDCILIINTLYEWIKYNNVNRIKNDIKEFINYLNENILSKNDIDKVEIDYWNEIKKSRNSLTSCHIESEKLSYNSINEISTKLKKIIDWIYKYETIEANNNFNKFVYCVSKKIR